MKIAITGSLGLIGSSLIIKLIRQKSFDIRELDVRYAKNSYSYVDISDICELTKKIQDCDGVIHLAAISRVAWAEQNKDLCYKVNVTGTSNIISACLSSKKRPWLIFASSREVYGAQDSFPISEISKPNPNNIYAKTKLTGEMLIEEAYQNGLKAFIVRLANVYGGVFDHIDRVIPAFCLNALKNKDIIVEGKDSILDFIFINDAVDAIIRAIKLLSSKSLNFIPKVNISTSKPTSLLELANIIVTITKSKSNVIICRQRSFSTEKFYGDNTLANKILNWKPQYNLAKGIKKFINSLDNKSQQDLIAINAITMRLREDENFKSYSWLPTEI